LDDKKEARAEGGRRFAKGGRRFTSLQKLADQKRCQPRGNENVLRQREEMKGTYM